jgi:hypothetical protein
MTRNPSWDSEVSNLTANNRTIASQQDGHSQSSPSSQMVDIRLRKEATLSIKILDMSADAIGNEGLSWTGALLKQTRGPLGSWRPRWFEIMPPPHAENNKLSSPHSRCAVLNYQSEGKHWKHFYVHDVRLERHLDSGLRIAFSMGISPANDLLKETILEHAQRRCAHERMLLMAPTDLEAVAFLSCLRYILEPEHAWPTLRDAIHYPGEALRGLARE